MLRIETNVNRATTLRLTTALLLGVAIAGPQSALAGDDPPSLVCPADTTLVSDLDDGAADCAAQIPDFSSEFPGRIVIQDPSAGTPFVHTQLVTIIVNGGEAVCAVTALVDGDDLNGNSLPDDCEGLDCCLFGDPRLLTMRYLGTSCDESDNLQGDDFQCEQYTDETLPEIVWIVANDKDNDPFGGKTWFSGVVELGEDFAIDAAVAGEDKLKGKTAIHVFAAMDLGGGDVAPGEWLQTSELKTNCSELLLTGDIYGASLLVDCRGKDEPRAGDCCTFGKPRVLTMQFNGLDCSSLSHGQEDDKVECEDFDAIPGKVRIVASDKANPFDSGAKVWFDGTVGLLGTYDIDAANAGESKLKSKTFIHVLGGKETLLQSVELHTSCSQPLHFGDQFGASILVGCVGEDEPADDTDGDACDAGGKPFEMSFSYEATTCVAWNEATGGPGGNSQGKSTKCAPPNDDPLPQTAVVVATNKRARDICKKGTKIYFCGEVSVGETLTVSALAAGEDDFGGKLYLHVFDPADLTGAAPCPPDRDDCAFDGADPRQTVKFKANCSKPLIPGEDFGAFRLESVSLD